MQKQRGQKNPKKLLSKLPYHNVSEIEWESQQKNYSLLAQIR